MCSSSSPQTDVVPAPKNLQFSDVTQTSFRATWDHGAPDVALYRIGWSKKGENNYNFVSLSRVEMVCRGHELHYFSGLGFGSHLFFYKKSLLDISLLWFIF